MQHFFHFLPLPHGHPELRPGSSLTFTYGSRFSLKIVSFVLRRDDPSGSVLPYFGSHQ
jgi:hypothetical protein